MIVAFDTMPYAPFTSKSALKFACIMLRRQQANFWSADLDVNGAQGVALCLGGSKDLYSIHTQISSPQSAAYHKQYADTQNIPKI